MKQQNLDAAGKVAAVLSNKVDGLIGFAHAQAPSIAAKSGKAMTYLRYAEEGINFYSNGLISSDGYLAKNPALAKEMMAAVSESFTAAIANPEAAAKSMEGKDLQVPAQAVVLEQWTETIKLLNTENTKGKNPGINDPADWAATIKTLSGAGLSLLHEPDVLLMDEPFGIPTSCGSRHVSVSCWGHRTAPIRWPGGCLCGTSFNASS